MSQSLGMFIVLVLILVQFGLLGWNFFTYSIRSAPTFIAKAPSGETLNLHPILRPNASTKSLLNWATVAVTATLTLDFFNYQKTLESLKQYFTKTGYNDFIAALNSQGIIDTIVSKKLVISAVPIGPAIIVGQEENRGFFSWRVQVPLTVSYLSASIVEKRYKLVTVLVSQVPTQEAAQGIGIVQYQAKEISAGDIRDLL